MTYGEIITQILSEITGQPKDHVGFLLEIFKTHYPTQNFDKELSPERAKTLIDGLRKEKAGILNWLAQGYGNVIKKMDQS